MNDETLNGYRPGEWLADEDDDDDAPAARSRIDDDTGAAAGCAFIVAVLTLCVALAWLLTQTGGVW